MATARPLTLFSARVCPWAHRATLTAREVGLYEDPSFSHVEIDLANKPEWYATKINPASKVPCLQIGTDEDSDVKRIPESGILLELIAELFPKSGLSPSSPIERAEARYFAERFTSIVAGPFNQLFLFGKKDQAAPLRAGIEEIQGLLNQHKGTFLLGDKLSVGDLAVAPFVGRIFAAGKYGFLTDELNESLTTDSAFSTFRAYHDAIVSRPSWAATFDPEVGIVALRKRIDEMIAAGKL